MADFELGHFELYELTGSPLELKRSIQKAILVAKQRYLQDSKHSIFTQYSQTDIKPEYLELRELLANKSWRRADLETTRLIFQVYTNELVNDVLDKGLISKRLEALSLISLEDLQTIDYLWVIYSNGHFGFSIQWEIFQQILDELTNNLKVVVTRDQLPDPEMNIYEYTRVIAKTFMGRLPTEFFLEKYPITGQWTPMTALTINLGWLSKGGSEWSFDRETNYSLDAPKGHLPTSGKQAFGFAFHHGFMLHHIFSKLYLDRKVKKLIGDRGMTNLFDC